MAPSGAVWFKVQLVRWFPAYWPVLLLAFKSLVLHTQDQLTLARAIVDLPFAIVAGAPFAFVVGGFVGPRLGRRVAGLFTPPRLERTGDAILLAGPGTLRIEAKPATLLVYASEEIAVRVQVAMASTTCEVMVASTPAQAIMRIQRIEKSFRPRAKQWASIECIVVLENIQFRPPQSRGRKE